MHNRSSIFSFNILKSFLKLSNSAIWSLFWLILFLGVSTVIYGQKAWKMVAGKRISKVINCLETNLQEGAKGEKFVLFLGSSRFEAGINENTLNTLNKKENITFLNLAQSSMGPWESETILTNSKIDFSKISLAVLELNPWTFNENYLHPIKKVQEKFRNEFDIWAPFSQRLAIPDWFARMNLISKMVMQRNTIHTYLRTITPRGKVRTLPSPPYHLNPEKAAKHRTNEIFFAENISRCHLNNYQFSARKQKMFVKVLSLFSQHDVPVVIVHPPLKESYFQVVSSGRQGREFLKHKSYINSLRAQIPVIYWETTKDCGLSDEVFIDYGHYTVDGSQIFSARLWTELKEHVQ